MPQHCIVCKESRATFLAGCECRDKLLHKRCLTTFARALYQEKRKTCETCGKEMSGITMMHWRKIIAERLSDGGFGFRKTGLRPVLSYSTMPSDERMQEVQRKWEDLVDAELSNAPEWCVKTLKNCRKHSVEWTKIVTTCKWD